MLQSNVTSGGSYLYIKSNDLCPVGEGLQARDLELEKRDYYAESQSFWRYWDETHGRPNANESHYRLDNEMIFRKIDEEDHLQINTKAYSNRVLDSSLNGKWIRK